MELWNDGVNFLFACCGIVKWWNGMDSGVNGTSATLA